jgi:hypothetical protein
VTGTRRQHPEAGRGQQYIGSKGRRQQEKIYGIIKRIKEEKKIKQAAAAAAAAGCWLVLPMNAEESDAGKG